MSASPEKRVPDLTPSSSPATSNEATRTEPLTPVEAASAPPPAYPGLSARKGRRSSWTARNDPNGSIVRPDDLGNGSDTLRPFKRVDTDGSLRLSADYLGSGSLKAKEDEVPISTASINSAGSGDAAHKRTKSEHGRAGLAMVSDVIIPTIQNVSFLCIPFKT